MEAVAVGILVTGGYVNSLVGAEWSGAICTYFGATRTGLWLNVTTITTFNRVPSLP